MILTVHTPQTHTISPFPSADVYFSKWQHLLLRELRQRRQEREGNSDKWGLEQQTDRKVNIPLVEILRLHAGWDLIGPIGVLQSEPVCVARYLCLHVLELLQKQTTASWGCMGALWMLYVGFIACWWICRWPGCNIRLSDYLFSAHWETYFEYTCWILKEHSITNLLKRNRDGLHLMLTDWFRQVVMFVFQKFCARTRVMPNNCVTKLHFVKNIKN